MIKLTYKDGRPPYSFAWVASAGALGFAGHDEGHGLASLWKFPFRLLGCIRTSSFAFFTKTVTMLPRAGNLRSYAPWRAVRLLSASSMVNSVGLTNPGLPAWLDRYLPLCKQRYSSGQRTFLSISPTSQVDLVEMLHLIEPRSKTLAGIEIDFSCANTGSAPLPDEELIQIAIGYMSTAAQNTSLPVGIKFGFQQPYYQLACAVDGLASWIHLINATPWYHVFSHETSPLRQYGYDGAVSGTPIRHLSRQALFDAVRRPAIKNFTPIISGGGILDATEAHLRFDMGADAVALGSVFLLRPWRPESIRRSLPCKPGFLEAP